MDGLDDLTRRHSDSLLSADNWLILQFAITTRRVSHVLALRG